jgi:hypothetical protein
VGRGALVGAGEAVVAVDTRVGQHRSVNWGGTENRHPCLGDALDTERIEASYDRRGAHETHAGAGDHVVIAHHPGVPPAER